MQPLLAAKCRFLMEAEIGVVDTGFADASEDHTHQRLDVSCTDELDPPQSHNPSHLLALRHRLARCP